MPLFEDKQHKAGYLSEAPSIAKYKTKFVYMMKQRAKNHTINFKIKSSAFDNSGHSAVCDGHMLISF